MDKIGIIGNGYVGGAVAHGFSPASTGTAELRVHDKLPEKSLDTLEDTVNNSDFIFVCVPTPMNKKRVDEFKVYKQSFQGDKRRKHSK